MNTNFKNRSLKLTFSAAVLAGLAVAPGAWAQNNTFQPSTSFLVPTVQSVETGPILDVVPYVLADGFTINLALIPSDTEFGGYANPQIPNFNTGGGAIGNLNAALTPTAFPTFTVRQLVTTVNVWDNQTVVLGGLITSSVSSTKNKVPMLGDLPLVGRLFQSQTKSTSKDNLMIFVTSTIVDPSGARVHSDDELPFAQALKTVPVQPVDNVSQPMSVKTVGLDELPK